MVQSARRTQQQLFGDTFLNGFPDFIHYAAAAEFDASPAAQEVFVGGVSGARLWLPTNTAIYGIAMLAAWNATDNSNPAFCRIAFGIQNAAGTVGFFPTNLTGTAGNPIIEHTAGIGTWALTADNTNKSLNVNFTGVASKVYNLAGKLLISGVNGRSALPNRFRQVT